MLPSATSVIASAASGSIIKIVAGLLQNMSDAAAERRSVQHEQRMAELGKEIKAYEVQVSNPHTSVTRRWLAFGVCLTLCSIAAFCTVFPDVIFWTVPPSSGEAERYSVLFGLIEWSKSPKLETLILTSGSMAYLFVHASIMYLGFYFTPIGKK